MDHQHVQIYSSHMSCGVLELSNMRSEPEKVLFALCTHLYHPSRGAPAAYVAWSDTKESDGLKFTRYLLSIGYKLHAGPNTDYSNFWVENPKTGNQISVWLWILPHEELKKWYVEERIKRAKQV